MLFCELSRTNFDHALHRLPGVQDNGDDQTQITSLGFNRCPSSHRPGAAEEEVPVNSIHLGRSRGGGRKNSRVVSPGRKLEAVGRDSSRPLSQGFSPRHCRAEARPKGIVGRVADPTTLDGTASRPTVQPPKHRQEIERRGSPSN